MKTNRITYLFWISLISPCFASPPNPNLSDTIWNSIKIFEGSARAVSTDFDCQGMSIGIAQWNLGKSFASIKQIFFSIPQEKRMLSMPNYGADFEQALLKGKNETLKFVRALQTIENPESCDAKTRKAHWNSNGSVFSREMSTLLSSSESVAKQRLLRGAIFSEGLRNAMKWAAENRGKDAAPTLQEVAYFVDMQNFNGGGLSKFGIDAKPMKANDNNECTRAAIMYLRTANQAWLLHKEAARKNSNLLNINSLSKSDSDLFCFSYKVALQLNTNYSRQFKLTTINRRAAILFGQAYYSDRDQKPVEISFSDFN